MLFHRKGRLRREFDELLLRDLVKQKEQWEKQKHLIEKCFDPSLEVLSNLELEKAKYLFLLKEAKQRKINIRS